MKTIEEANERFVNHLAEMDLSKLSVQELSVYAHVLKSMDKARAFNYADYMMDAYANCCCAIGTTDDKKKELS